MDHSWLRPEHTGIDVPPTLVHRTRTTNTTMCSSRTGFAAPIQSPELHRPLDCKCVVQCGLGAHWLGQKGSDVNVRTFLTGAASCEGGQRHCADSFAIDHQRGVGARSLNHPGRIALNKTQGAGWQGPAVSTTYHTGICARARTSGWMAKLPCCNGDCRLIPPDRHTRPQIAPTAAGLATRQLAPS